MSLAQEPFTPAGVDGGTETWHARPDGRFPACGCEHPEEGHTEHDWMVCQCCGLVNVLWVLRGPRAEHLHHGKGSDKLSG